jgi:4,5-DOPA dioxygenase extradiol
MESTLMPVFFFGHGSPMNAVEDNPFTRALQKIRTGIDPLPTAILSVSAHWLTRGTFIHSGKHPETIHDFGGFPGELYTIRYPAPGSPQLAREVSAALPEIQETIDWGLDHGTWSILLHLFPEASIPVVQLSIDYDRPMEYHFNLGRKLAFLRREGVMIIGSGNVVHNLRYSFERLASGDSTAYPWAIEFDQWVKERIETRDFEALCNYAKEERNARLAVPTPDHYIPLLYTLALAREEEPIIHCYEEVSYGGLSMRSLRIG